MNPRFDWRDPRSEPEKARLIFQKHGKLWGDELETYLFYEVGDVDGLTRSELVELSEQFVRGCRFGFGDLEFLRSQTIPGNPMLLRLRGLLLLHSSLHLRGRTCPLVQVGAGSDPAVEEDPDCINFHHVWKQNQM